MTAPAEKHCAQCGKQFGCGAALPDCWCKHLAPLPAARLSPGADCLCPDCLQSALARVSGAAGERER